MKLIVRTFAIALLVGGIVASTHSQQTHTVALGSMHRTGHQVNSLMPAPSCPPDDPDGCGIGPDPK